MPARLSARVLDSRGATVWSEEETLGSERFLAGGSLDRLPPPSVVTSGRQAPEALFAIRGVQVRRRLLLRDLAPGLYLLNFQATIGQEILVRDVPFEVR
jgi:hypothetical protein